MIPVINDIDRLLQAAPSRYGQAYDRRLALSASARAFSVALDATVSPDVIVFIASRVGFSGGTVEFSTDTGTPLTVDGDVATMVGADLKASGCEITATITYQGEQYEAKQSIVKVLGFDSSTPPAPANLHIAGTLASIQLSWDPTNNPNIGAVEIWRALVNDLSTAAAVGTTSGLARTYVDAIGAGGSFFYWIRYISKANIAGPFNAVAGTLGTAGTDAEYLLTLLQDEITRSQLHEDLGQQIDLIAAPPEVVGSVAWHMAREEQGRVEGDAVLAARIAQIAVNSGDFGALIREEAEARADADEAIASDVLQLQAVVTDPETGLVEQFAAVKVTAEASASAVNGVKAKYGVQVDTDGVAGGFELLGGGGKVDFGVRANTFFVAAPKGAGIPNQVPFVVRTTWTTVGGFSYPPGVYMDQVFVYNLSGDRIAVKSLKADRIDAAQLSAISADLGTVTAARIQSAASGQRVVTTQLGTVMLNQFNNRLVLLGDDSLWG